jgi:hypothetical protein
MGKKRLKDIRSTTDTYNSGFTTCRKAGWISEGGNLFI